MPLHKSPEKSTYRHISVTVASPCSLPCSAWLRLRSNRLFCYLSDSHDKRCWNSLNAMERCSNAFFLRSFSIRYAGRLWRPTVPCSSSIDTGTLTYLLPISRKNFKSTLQSVHWVVRWFLELLYAWVYKHITSREKKGHFYPGVFNSTWLILCGRRFEVKNLEVMIMWPVRIQMLHPGHITQI